MNGIEIPKPWKCPRCGGLFEYTQPVVMRGMRGLLTTLHECGKNFQAAILTPGNEETKAFWKRVLG